MQQKQLRSILVECLREAGKRNDRCLWLCVQEYTNYYFDCKPAALHGALDRFSQFFVAPLCKADALDREVNAVDNEFSGRLLLPECICPSSIVQGSPATQ